jgi:hypothetical protein
VIPSAPEHDLRLWATDWLVALGILALAFIAVFQDRIRSWLSRPRLEMLFEEVPPDCHKTELIGDFLESGIQKQIFSDCYYFHFRVKKMETAKPNILKPTT